MASTFLQTLGLNKASKPTARLQKIILGTFVCEVSTFSIHPNNNQSIFFLLWATDIMSYNPHDFKKSKTKKIIIKK